MYALLQKLMQETQIATGKILEKVDKLLYILIHGANLLLFCQGMIAEDYTMNMTLIENNEYRYFERRIIMKKLICVAMVLILALTYACTAVAEVKKLHEDDYMYIDLTTIPGTTIAMIKVNLKLTAAQYSSLFMNNPSQFVDALNETLGSALTSDAFTAVTSIVTNDGKTVYVGVKGNDASWLLEYDNAE